METCNQQLYAKYHPMLYFELCILKKKVRHSYDIFLITVRVFDRWTCNQTCFNAARALKPLNNGEAKPINCVEVPVGSKVPDCDFCTPLDFTAAGKTGHGT